MRSRISSSLWRVIENGSDSSRRIRDLGLKLEQYEIAGIPEYWIVDPESERVEVLVLGKGKCGLFERFGRSDVLRSRVLEGLEIPLQDVFPED